MSTQQEPGKSDRLYDLITASPDPTKPMTLLGRREIEAQVIGPLVRAFAAEFGFEHTIRILRQVISDLARKSGSELAQAVGQATLTAFASCLDTWKAGGALEVEVLEQSADRWEFNVTRCRFAELYRQLGLEDLGSSLSCARDFALVEGFSPEIQLTRTQTIMEGASHCDFRFRAKAPIGEPGTTREHES